MIGPTNRKNWLTFDGDPVQDTDFGSFFCFPHRCVIMDFRRFISISHSHWLIFTTLGEMTEADKVMNPQHFGSDPADVWIRIESHLEIWIQIPDELWLTLDSLVKVCTAWAQSSTVSFVSDLDKVNVRFTVTNIINSHKQCHQVDWLRLSVVLVLCNRPRCQRSCLHQATTCDVCS